MRTSADYRIYNDFTARANESLERLRPSVYIADAEFRIQPGTNMNIFESSPIIEVK